MLRKNQSALMVKRDVNWKYVFCVNQYGAIVTTENREKALNASYDMEWFKNKFGNDLFASDMN
jgi:hypothetical protein